MMAVVIIRVGYLPARNGHSWRNDSIGDGRWLPDATSAAIYWRRKYLIWFYERHLEDPRSTCHLRHWPVLTNFDRPVYDFIAVMQISAGQFDQIWLNFDQIGWIFIEFSVVFVVCRWDWSNFQSLINRNSSKLVKNDSILTIFGPTWSSFFLFWLNWIQIWSLSVEFQPILTKFHQN